MTNSIRQNFKQSWQIIKQNKLFSGIYIAGTAIAISMVMVIAIVWIAKTANLYPEVNRSRMMSVKGITEQYEDGMNASDCSHKLAEEIIRTTKTLECATEVFPAYEVGTLRTTGDDKYQVYYEYADHFFWKVMEFDFLAGMPFTEEDVASKITKAVISETTAKKYFDGVEEAIGKHFSLNFVEYAVCGVVKDVSAIMTVAYSDIWLPITTFEGYDIENGETGYIGSELIYILAHSSKDFSKIRSEVDEKVAAFNNTMDGLILDLLGQPEPYAKGLLRVWSNEAPDIDAYVWKLVLIVLILLLVPAINLAGMISSKMTKRMEEMGIRKTFGATKRSILSQIINENLLLTFMGGVVGIILSYLILAISGSIFVNMIVPLNTFGLEVDTHFTLSMLMNPWIFVIAFVVCLVLNLMAAIIPAAHSLKHNIVDSLNVKQ